MVDIHHHIAHYMYVLTSNCGMGWMAEILFWTANSNMSKSRVGLKFTSCCNAILLD